METVTKNEFTRRYFSGSARVTENCSKPCAEGKHSVDSEWSC